MGPAERSLSGRRQDPLGDASGSVDPVVGGVVAGRLHLGQKFRHPPDAFEDDVVRKVGVGEIGRDGGRLAEPSARGGGHGEFFGRDQVFVEPSHLVVAAHGPTLHASSRQAASQNRYS